jgi:steroid delta-isomerase-like uncharacterized protein
MNSHTAPTTTDVNADLVRRYSAEIWEHRNLDAIPEYLHPDFVLNDPGLPGPVYGADGLEQHIRDLLGAFPDLRDEIHHVVGVDDTTVLASTTVSGTHDGRFGPLPPTGRRIELDVLARLRIEDGRIREESFFYDPAELRRQLGASGVGVVRLLPRILWTNVRTRMSRRTR